MNPIINVRPAVQKDLSFIEALRRKEWEKVGFVPFHKYESAVDHSIGELLVVEYNGLLAGFLYGAHGRRLSTVFQIAVQDDLRRNEAGTALVDELGQRARAKGRFGLKCRAAVTLTPMPFGSPWGLRMWGPLRGATYGDRAGIRRGMWSGTSDCGSRGSLTGVLA